MIFLLLTMAHAALNCPPDAADAYPALVKIVRRGPEYEGYCTGTHVGGGYILTAAHCLYNATKRAQTLAAAGDFRILTGVKSEKDLGPVIQVVPFPDFRHFGPHDVGLLRLARPSLPALPLSALPVRVGDRVTVGGYGAVKHASWAFQPLRHVGDNVVTAVTPADIFITGAMIADDGRTALDSPYCLPIGQDSGSPLIHDGHVRGLSYTGREEWLRDGRTHLQELTYVNLADVPVRDFLRAHLGEHWCRADLEARPARPQSDPPHPKKEGGT